MATATLGEMWLRKFLRVLFEEVVVVIIIVVKAADGECVTEKASALSPERRMDAKIRKGLRRQFLMMWFMIIW